MDDKRKLYGHPWHIGYLKMAENDTRRDKRRCIHFLRDDFHKNYCRKNFVNCIGSSHCPDYKEIADSSVNSVNSDNSVNGVNIEELLRNEELLRKIFKENE